MGNSEEEHKFFVVRVPRGYEVDLMFLIRHRIEVFNLPIYSAFYLDEQDGIVFIEADDYDTVVRAVRYFRGAVAFKEPLSWSEVEKYLEKFQVKYERREEEGEVKIEPGIMVEIVDGPFAGQKGRVVSVKKNKVWVDLVAGGAILVPIPIEYVKPVEEKEFYKRRS